MLYCYFSISVGITDCSAWQSRKALATDRRVDLTAAPLVAGNAYVFASCRAGHDFHFDACQGRSDGGRRRAWDRRPRHRLDQLILLEQSDQADVACDRKRRRRGGGLRQCRALRGALLGGATEIETGRIIAARRHLRRTRRMARRLAGTRSACLGVIRRMPVGWEVCAIRSRHAQSPCGFFSRGLRRGLPGRLGPMIENDPLSRSASTACRESRKEDRAAVWERGAGLTMAAAPRLPTAGRRSAAGGVEPVEESFPGHAAHRLDRPQHSDARSGVPRFLRRMTWRRADERRR